VIIVARKNINNTLDEELYTDIRILGLKIKRNANDLIEEGMRMVLEKYKEQADKKRE
jgi:hypothetical protein